MAPVITATVSLMLIFLGLTTAARFPRRAMWMRSAISNTWGMLWLMRITGRPLSRTRRISSSTMLPSFTPRAAVGSSMMTTWRANAAARATATHWRWPPDNVSTACVMERMPTFSSAMRATLSSSIFFLSSMRSALPNKPGRSSSRPKKRFSAIVMAGATARSWYTVSMPALRASMGLLNWMRWPSSRISPSSGTVAPDSALIRLDLPAPLSPITARISPARSSKSAPSSAVTCP